MDDQIRDAAFDAALTNQKLLSVIIAMLAANGALSLHQVAEALDAERAFIDQLREEADPRLHGQMFQTFVGMLEQSLGVLGLPMPPVLSYRTNPADPLWPNLPDNDR